MNFAHKKTPLISVMRGVVTSALVCIAYSTRVRHTDCALIAQQMLVIVVVVVVIKTES